MAGTSETLLEARIISTAFGCLSSGSAGGDKSGGTNRSSCVFVMGVGGDCEENGLWSSGEKDAGTRLALNTSQGTVGPASHTARKGSHVALSCREARHYQCS